MQWMTEPHVLVGRFTAGERSQVHPLALCLSAVRDKPDVLRPPLSPWCCPGLGLMACPSLSCAQGQILSPLFILRRDGWPPEAPWAVQLGLTGSCELAVMSHVTTQTALS